MCLTANQYDNSSFLQAWIGVCQQKPNQNVYAALQDDIVTRRNVAL